MTYVHWIKKLNNTELGKGSTHETYVLVPQEADVSDLFEQLATKYPFIDKDTGGRHELRLTSGREKRIVGLGPFYREHNVCPGDEVCLEKRVDEEGKCDYFIAVNHFPHIIVFQKKKNLFSTLTPERLSSMLNIGQEWETGSGDRVTVCLRGEFRLREDSPGLTCLYDICLNGENLADRYQNGQMLEMLCTENKVKYCRFARGKNT